MKAIGILFGIIMIVSVFIPWEIYTGQENLFLTRISYFLGIKNYAFDSLSILCTLLFIVSISLANKHITWRILTLIFSLICAFTSIHSLLLYNFLGKEPNYVAGTGLWLFSIASLLALILSILILLKKNLLEKKLFDPEVKS